MTWLILGLMLFLGIHSIRIFFDDWRTEQLARFGATPWKAAYSLASLAGLGLIVWGYSQARALSAHAWYPPPYLYEGVFLLNLAAVVLVTAAYIPRNAIRKDLRHPLLLGVQLWAAGHLLSNGRVADIVLFGSFLVWAKLCYRAACRRDRLGAAVVRRATVMATASTLAVACAASAAILFWLHAALFGMRAWRFSFHFLMPDFMDSVHSIPY